MKEYYTVKEIAELLEISVQATYGRIKQTEKTLKTLNLDFKEIKETLNLDYKVKKGNKTLYSWYFIEFLKENDFKETLNTLKQDIKDFKPTLNQEETGKTDGAGTDESSKVIEILQKQLEEKDKQIQSLQELVKNSQVLLLNEQQKVKQLESKIQDTQQTADNERTENEPREKQGFFSRLFKRK